MSVKLDLPFGSGAGDDLRAFEEAMRGEVVAGARLIDELQRVGRPATRWIGLGAKPKLQTRICTADGEGCAVAGASESAETAASARRRTPVISNS